MLFSVVRAKKLLRKDISMRIAIPIWERRISPVFDTAKEFTVAEIERGRITSQFKLPLQEIILPRRAAILTRWKINILICGGISAYLANLVTARGIRVVPGIRGEVDNVLQAYCRGDLTSPQYEMPGWRGWRRTRYDRRKYTV